MAKPKQIPPGVYVAEIASVEMKYDGPNGGVYLREVLIIPDGAGGRLVFPSTTKPVITLTNSEI